MWFRLGLGSGWPAARPGAGRWGWAGFSPRSPGSLQTLSVRATEAVSVPGRWVRGVCCCPRGGQAALLLLQCVRTQGVRGHRWPSTSSQGSSREPWDSAGAIGGLPEFLPPPHRLPSSSAPCRLGSGPCPHHDLKQQVSGPRSWVTSSLDSPRGRAPHVRPASALLRPRVPAPRCLHNGRGSPAGAGCPLVPRLRPLGPMSFRFWAWPSP